MNDRNRVPQERTTKMQVFQQYPARRTNIGACSPLGTTRYKLATIVHYSKFFHHDNYILLCVTTLYHIKTK